MSGQVTQSADQLDGQARQEGRTLLRQPRRPTRPNPLIRAIDSPAGLRIIGLLLVLVVWQLFTTLNFFETSEISSPYLAAKAGWTLIKDGELGSNAVDSLVGFAIGLAIAIGIGVPLGLLMGRNRTTRRVFEPLIMALYVTPYLAFLPVLVVWLGIGNTAKIVVVFIASFIPIVINSIAGMRTVDPLLVRVARSLCASRLQLLTKILLPASLPSVITGIRLAVGRGVLGVVVSEIYVSTSGIGNLLHTYAQADNNDAVVFLVILVGVFAYCASALVGVLEKRVAGWRSQ